MADLYELPEPDMTDGPVESQVEDGEPEPTTHDFLKMNFMQLQRIYDVLLVILEQQSATRYDQVVALHRNFGNVGPMPFMEEE
jgi:hypothetical protein